MDIDYRAGLDKVRPLADGTNWQLEFLTYEDRLLGSLSAYEEYGDQQQLSNIARVVRQLNRITLKHLKKSFNDLCKETALSGQIDTQLEQLPSFPQPAIPSSPILDTDVHSAKKMRRWAMLVGVNAYEDKNNYSHLQYCANDVKKLRTVLLAGGFEEDTIQTLSDQETRLPRREYILPILQSLVDYTEPGDLLLFYFAGHGLEQNGESYLVPCNAFGVSLRDVAIPVSRVKEIIEGAKASKKVLIFDACHSGTLKGVRGITDFMSTEFIKNICNNAHGLAILSSCDQGERSYDWAEEECGVYTYYLLEALAGKAAVNGQVTVHSVSNYVYHHVKQWARQHLVVQSPTLNYFVSGEIDLIEYHSPDQENTGVGDLPKQEPQEEEVLLAESRDLAKEASQSILYWQELAEEIQNLFSGDQDIWSSHLQTLIQQFHEKVWTLALDGDCMQRINEQTQRVIIRVNYLHDQMKDLVDRLEQFCAIDQPGKLQQEKRVLLSKLGVLQTELIKVQDALFFLIPLLEDEDEQDRSSLSLITLESYVGDVDALRDGNVHASMKKRLQERGVQVHHGEENRVEDILERYMAVPLHAVFLYTTEDRGIEEYILKNWQALASISGNNCDIYFSLAQFKNAEDGYGYPEDGYGYIDKLDVIKQADFNDYTQLPGLFFWDSQGATAYAPFGADGKHETITSIIRLVFREIKREASIASILYAKKILEL